MKLTLPFCLFTSFQIEKNMSAGKWIGGILGFMSGGALGALAGVALGALFDYGLKAVNREEGGSTGEYSGGNDAWNQARKQQYYEGQRNSFLFSLLVLASYIIKADGKVMHSEMEFVRRFLRMNFGEAAVEVADDGHWRLDLESSRFGAENGARLGGHRGHGLGRHVRDLEALRDRENVLTDVLEDRSGFVHPR